MFYCFSSEVRLEKHSHCGLGGFYSPCPRILEKCLLLKLSNCQSKFYINKIFCQSLINIYTKCFFPPNFNFNRCTFSNECYIFTMFSGALTV